MEGFYDRASSLALVSKRWRGLEQTTPLKLGQRHVICSDDEDVLLDGFYWYCARGALPAIWARGAAVQGLLLQAPIFRDLCELSLGGVVLFRDLQGEWAGLLWAGLQQLANLKVQQLQSGYGC